MKATLISYVPGLSGDFIAYMAHQDPSYYPIDLSWVDNIKVTKHNMWRFPNLLRPIGLEAKTYPLTRPWTVDQNLLNILHDIYGDKKILLPSHWYRPITPENTNGLFDRGIRLYADSYRTLKICSALWWVKSHAIATDIWPHRQEEIEEMIRSNHPLKHLLPDILQSYHNWKYTSIRYNILKDGQLDLPTYIRRHLREVYSYGNSLLYTENYLRVAVDNLVYGDLSNLEVVEDYLGVSIDRQQVKSYSETNYDLLNKCLGIDVNSSEFDNDEIYFDAIYNYVKGIIDARPNQFDYYNGKCN